MYTNMGIKINCAQLFKDSLYVRSRDWPLTGG